MSRKHTLAIGCLLLAALAAAYAFVSGFSAREDRKREQAEAAGVIPFTDCAELAALSYTSADTSISFEKDKDGIWKYTEDDDFPALQASVQTLANDLGDMTAKRDLGEVTDLSVYGLDAPAATFSFTGTDGQDTVITIGNETEDGDYYAIKSGDSHVYTISDVLMNYSDYTLYDWLKTDELPSVFTADVKEFKIDAEGKSSHYIRTGKDDEGNFIWYRDSKESEENRVEDVSVPNHLATAITNLAIFDCADYKVTDSELSQYGLDNPKAVIWFSYEEEDSQSDSGSETEDDTEAAKPSEEDSSDDENAEDAENAENGSDDGSGMSSLKEFSIEIGSLDESGEYYYVRPAGSMAADRIEKSLVDDCLNEPSSNAGSDTP